MHSRHFQKVVRGFTRWFSSVQNRILMMSLPIEKEYTKKFYVVLQDDFYQFRIEFSWFVRGFTMWFSSVQNRILMMIFPTEKKYTKKLYVVLQDDFHQFRIEFSWWVLPVETGYTKKLYVVLQGHFHQFRIEFSSWFFQLKRDTPKSCMWFYKERQQGLNGSFEKKGCLNSIRTPFLFQKNYSNHVPFPFWKWTRF